MPGCLRLACIGDSWVTDWSEESPDKWRMHTPMTDALRAGFSALGSADIELITAGFPGATSARILELAQLCKVRDMAKLSAKSVSIKQHLEYKLEKAGITNLKSLPRDARVCEDIDVIVLVLGSNDLSTSTWDCASDSILHRLRKLKHIFRVRGSEVVTVSVGGGANSLLMADMTAEELQALEEQRAHTNAALLAEDGVVDCDALLHGLVNPWKADGWHLTDEGYEAFGRRLAQRIVRRYEPSEIVVSDSEHWLTVQGCQSPILSRIVAGGFHIDGSNHCRPIYRKRAADGVQSAVFYFWDMRDGPEYAGWWFGPNMNWEDPGWGHHEDCSSMAPPTSGWRVPSCGPVDGAFQLHFHGCAPRLKRRRTSYKQAETVQDASSASKSLSAEVGSASARSQL